MKEPLELLVHGDLLEGVAQDGSRATEIIVKTQQIKTRKVSDQHLGKSKVMLQESRRITDIEMKSLQIRHLGQLFEVN